MGNQQTALAGIHPFKDASDYAPEDLDPAFYSSPHHQQQQQLQPLPTISYNNQPVGPSSRSSISYQHGMAPTSRSTVSYQQQGSTTGSTAYQHPFISIETSEGGVVAPIYQHQDSMSIGMIRAPTPPPRRASADPTRKRDRLARILKVELFNKKLSLRSLPKMISRPDLSKLGTLLRFRRKRVIVGEVYPVPPDAERPSPPSKPDVLHEQDEYFLVRWDPPAYDGGLPIIGYVIQHLELGLPQVDELTGQGDESTSWFSSEPGQVTSTEVLLNNLIPGTTYQFRIIAENLLGYSQPGDLSDPIVFNPHGELDDWFCPPVLIIPLDDVYTVIEHERLILTVEITGQPYPIVRWYDKHEMEMCKAANPEKYSTLSSGQKRVLTIASVQLCDAGSVRCVGENEKGIIETNCSIIVEAPPHIHRVQQLELLKLQNPYELTVAEQKLLEEKAKEGGGGDSEEDLIFQAGELARLKFMYSGAPKPNVCVYHEGDLVDGEEIGGLRAPGLGKRVNTEITENLITVKVPSIRRSDRGEWVVRLDNVLGEDMALVLITVTDRPTQPGKPDVLQLSDNTCILKWDKPYDDGGCPVQAYTVEYFRSEWGVWLKACTTKNPYTKIRDLIPGSKYKFRVKAENLYGVSNPSDDSVELLITDLVSTLRAVGGGEDASLLMKTVVEEDEPEEPGVRVEEDNPEVARARPMPPRRKQEGSIRVSTSTMTEVSSLKRKKDFSLFAPRTQSPSRLSPEHQQQQHRSPSPRFLQVSLQPQVMVLADSDDREEPPPLQPRISPARSPSPRLVRSEFQKLDDETVFRRELSPTLGMVSAMRGSSPRTPRSPVHFEEEEEELDQARAGPPPRPPPRHHAQAAAVSSGITLALTQHRRQESLEEEEQQQQAAASKKLYSRAEIIRSAATNVELYSFGFSELSSMTDDPEETDEHIPREDPELLKVKEALKNDSLFDDIEDELDESYVYDFDKLQAEYDEDKKRGMVSRQDSGVSARSVGREESIEEPSGVSRQESLAEEDSEAEDTRPRSVQSETRSSLWQPKIPTDPREPFERAQSEVLVRSKHDNRFGALPQVAAQQQEPTRHQTEYPQARHQTEYPQQPRHQAEYPQQPRQPPQPMEQQQQQPRRPSFLEEVQVTQLPEEEYLEPPPVQPRRPSPARVAPQATPVMLHDRFTDYIAMKASSKNKAVGSSLRNLSSSRYSSSESVQSGRAAAAAHHRSSSTSRDEFQREVGQPGEEEEDEEHGAGERTKLKSYVAPPFQFRAFDPDAESRGVRKLEVSTARKRATSLTLPYDLVHPVQSSGEEHPPAAAQTSTPGTRSGVTQDFDVDQEEEEPPPQQAVARKPATLDLDKSKQIQTLLPSAQQAAVAATNTITTSKAVTPTSPCAPLPSSRFISTPEIYSTPVPTRSFVLEHSRSETNFDAGIPDSMLKQRAASYLIMDDDVTEDDYSESAVLECVLTIPTTLVKDTGNEFLNQVREFTCESSRGSVAGGSEAGLRDTSPFEGVLDREVPREREDVVPRWGGGGADGGDITDADEISEEVEWSDEHALNKQVGEEGIPEEEEHDYDELIEEEGGEDEEVYEDREADEEFEEEFEGSGEHDEEEEEEYDEDEERDFEEDELDEQEGVEAEEGELEPLLIEGGGVGDEEVVQSADIVRFEEEEPPEKNPALEELLAKLNKFLEESHEEDEREEGMLEEKHVERELIEEDVQSGEQGGAEPPMDDNKASEIVVVPLDVKEEHTQIMEDSAPATEEDVKLTTVQPTVIAEEESRKEPEVTDDAPVDIVLPPLDITQEGSPLQIGDDKKQSILATEVQDIIMVESVEEAREQPQELIEQSEPTPIQNQAPAAHIPEESGSSVHDPTTILLPKTAVESTPIITPEQESHVYDKDPVQVAPPGIENKFENEPSPPPTAPQRHKPQQTMKRAEPAASETGIILQPAQEQIPEAPHFQPVPTTTSHFESESGGNLFDDLLVQPQFQPRFDMPPPPSQHQIFVEPAPPQRQPRSTVPKRLEERLGDDFFQTVPPKRQPSPTRPTRLLETDVPLRDDFLEPRLSPLQRQPSPQTRPTVETEFHGLRPMSPQPRQPSPTRPRRFDDEDMPRRDDLFEPAPPPQRQRSPSPTYPRRFETEARLGAEFFQPVPPKRQPSPTRHKTQLELESHHHASLRPSSPTPLSRPETQAHPVPPQRQHSPKPPRKFEPVRDTLSPERQQQPTTSPVPSRFDTARPVQPIRPIQPGTAVVPRSTPPQAPTQLHDDSPTTYRPNMSVYFERHSSSSTRRTTPGSSRESVRGASHERLSLSRASVQEPIPEDKPYLQPKEQKLQSFQPTRPKQRAYDPAMGAYSDSSASSRSSTRAQTPDLTQPLPPNFPPLIFPTSPSCGAAVHMSRSPLRGLSKPKTSSIADLITEFGTTTSPPTNKPTDHHRPPTPDTVDISEIRARAYELERLRALEPLLRQTASPEPETRAVTTIRLSSPIPSEQPVSPFMDYLLTASMYLILSPMLLFVDSLNLALMFLVVVACVHFFVVKGFNS